MDKAGDIPALGSCLQGKGKVGVIQKLWDQEMGEKIRKIIVEKG